MRRLRKNKRYYIYLFILILMCVYVFYGLILEFAKKPVKVKIVKSFIFDNLNSLKEWDEKIFKGKVDYKILLGKDNFIQAISKGTCSALYYELKMSADDPNIHPVLSWQWNAIKFPNKPGPEKIGKKEHDDYAARMYVIFPAAFFLNSKVLEYVWAENIKEGVSGDSPFSKNIKQIVLRSGHTKDGKLVKEERDIYEDYIKEFGNPPKLKIGAIAIMTDSDSTNSEAIGEYKDIVIGYKEANKK